MSMLGKGSKTGRTPTPSSQRKISSFFTPKTAIGNDSSSGKSTERKGTSDRPADGVDTEGNEAALMELDAEEGPEVIASALKIPSNGKLAGFRFETSTSSDLRNPLSKSRNADILRQRAARLQLKLNSDSGSTIGESQKRARDDEEEEEKSAKRRPIKIKHTPLELQVIDLKAKHAGVLLVVEVGYKYRFFGDDARVASQELGIVAYQDHNFLTCSVPTHRVNVHVKKLVLLGHKVGIVNQMETAAIKAVGDNKSAPFTRTLTKLYTKGTFIDDVDDESMQGDSQSYLLSISENVVSDAKVKVSLVAMLISTGDVIYDCFDDTLNRDELETRFAHIQPSELLLPVKLSTRTEKVITRYTARRSSNRSECARIERLAIVKDYSKSLQDLTNFYESDVAGKGFTEDLLTKVFALPEGVVVCLASLLSYLKEFGIENAVTKLSFFQTFDSRAQMMLSATTVENLELFRNSTDGRPIGSLLSVIDQTSSKFGKRLFRKWVSRPLIDQTALIRRIDAVEELIKKEADDCIQIHKIRALLRQVPDLERSLTKLYHVKSSPSELLSTLNAFEKVCDSAIPGTKYKSDLLNELIEKLPTVRGHVVAFKMLLNKDAAAANDKILLFAQEEQWPKIIELKEGILRVEGEFIEVRFVLVERFTNFADTTTFRQHLKEIRKTVGDSTLDFTSVSGIDYLIEVKNARTKSVPKQWLKISTTKAVTRFHTPLIATKTKERERYREELRLTCDAAYIELLHDVAEQYDAFRDVSSALANLDCLMSLAAAAQKPGYVRPEFVDGSVMQVKAGRHPVGETHLSNYVPNDIAFDEVKRTLILTGPVSTHICFPRRRRRKLILGTDSGRTWAASRATSAKSR